MSDLWRDTMIAGFRDAVMQILLVLPRLLALVTFLLIGLAMAWLVRVLTVRVLTAFRFDRLCERLGLDQPLAQAGIKQPASVVLGRILFWTVFLLFAFMGVDAVNLPATANLISQIVGFLPNVLAAALVLLIGVLSANFFAEAALIAAVNAQLQEARIVASLVGDSIIHVCHGADAVGHRQRNRHLGIFYYLRRRRLLARPWRGSRNPASDA